MKSATYTVREAAPTRGAVAAGSAAYKSLDGVGVTLFSSPNMACAAYVGSFLWSCVLIFLDAMLVVPAADEHATSTTHRFPEAFADGNNNWGVLIAGLMLGMDVLVLVTQGIDLYCCHFTRWPLTSLTWFGMLNGTGLASALLGMYMHYPWDTQYESKDSVVLIAMLNLAAHALFISSQFSVTIEYLVRAVKK